MRARPMVQTSRVIPALLFNKLTLLIQRLYPIRNGLTEAGSFLHANETFKLTQQQSPELRQRCLSLQSVWFSFPASPESSETESSG
jgi:hypothetical protein